MGKTVIFTPDTLRGSSPSVADQGLLVAAVERLAACLTQDGQANKHNIARADDLARETLVLALAAERERTELYRRVNRLETLVSTDELTGLLNRRGFEFEIDRALASARRYGEQGVLVYVDLDHFKEINDTLGHAMGDAVLKEVARLLSGNVRTTDVVARLGGDEFALLLKHTSFVDGMQRLSQIVHMFDPAQLKISAKRMEIRASVGFSEYGGTGLFDAAKLLASADTKMYEHKRQRGTKDPRHQSLSPLRKIA